MEWIELLLGGGLLITAGGWLIERGAHKKTHEVIENTFTSHEEAMDKIEKNVCENTQKQQNQEVVQATILTELKYIRLKIDEIAERKSTAKQ